MPTQPNRDLQSTQNASDPWTESIFTKRPSTTIIYRKPKKARKMTWKELQSLKKIESEGSIFLGSFSLSSNKLIPVTSKTKDIKQEKNSSLPLAILNSGKAAPLSSKDNDNSIQNTFPSDNSSAMGEPEAISHSIVGFSKRSSSLNLISAIPSTSSKRKRTTASELSANCITSENISDSNSVEISSNSRPNKRKGRKRKKKTSRNISGDITSVTRQEVRSNDFSYESPSNSCNLVTKYNGAVVPLEDLTPEEIAYLELNRDLPDFIQVPACLRRLQLLVYIVVVNCFSKFPAKPTKDEIFTLFESLITNLADLKKRLYSSGTEFLLNGDKPDNSPSGEYYNQIVSNINGEFIFIEEIIPHVTDLTILSNIIQDIQKLRDTYVDPILLLHHTSNPILDTQYTTGPELPNVIPSISNLQTNEPRLNTTSQVLKQPTKRSTKQCNRNSRRRVISSDDDDLFDELIPLANDSHLRISSVNPNHVFYVPTESLIKSPQIYVLSSDDDNEINLIDLSSPQITDCHQSISSLTSNQASYHPTETLIKSPQIHVFSSDDDNEVDLIDLSPQTNASHLSISSLTSNQASHNPTESPNNCSQICAFNFDDNNEVNLIDLLSPQASSSNLNSYNHLTESLIKSPQKHLFSIDDLEDDDLFAGLSPLSYNSNLSISSLFSNHSTKQPIKSPQLEVFSSDDDVDLIDFSSPRANNSNLIIASLIPNQGSNNSTQPIIKSPPKDVFSSDDDKDDELLGNLDPLGSDSNLSISSFISNNFFNDPYEFLPDSFQKRVFSSDDEDSD